jgi:hypothetical protein
MISRAYSRTKALALTMVTSEFFMIMAESEASTDGLSVCAYDSIAEIYDSK